MPRHSNTDTGWIKREFAAIKKQLRESGAGKRLESATIGRGGLTIKDNGTVRGRYTSGRLAFEIGGIAVTDDVVAHGMRVMADDDTTGTDFPLMEVFELDGARYVRHFGGFVVNKGSSGALMAAGAFDDPGAQQSVYVSALSGVQITHSTTGASANCFIDPSDNRVWREVSAAKYKQDIVDAEIDPAAVLQMQPITYRDKGEVERDPETEQRYVGLLAEDLVELGLSEFVTKNDEGEPEGIAYPRLTVALLAVLKDQEARLAALEAAAPNPEN